MRREPGRLAGAVVSALAAGGVMAGAPVLANFVAGLGSDDAALPLELLADSHDEGGRP